MRIGLVSLIAVIFLSGCIEIVESIKVNEDTSGTIQYRVMSSETGALLGSFSGLINNSIEDQLRSEASKLVFILKQQEGISNVKYELKNLNGEFYVRFDFASSEQFNKALYQMGGYKKTCLSPGYLKVKKHKVKKRNFTPWLHTYLKKEKIEILDSFLPEMLYFTSIIELPGVIRKVKPENMSVTDNNTIVQQRLSFDEILNDNESTGLKVRY